MNTQLTSNVWKLSKRELLLLHALTINTMRIFGNLIVGTSKFEEEFDMVYSKIDRATVELDKRYTESLEAMRRSVEFKRKNKLPGN